MHLLRAIFGRACCLLGLHDFSLIEATISFGQADMVEKVECRRCGLVSTRQARRE